MTMGQRLPKPTGIAFELPLRKGRSIGVRWIIAWATMLLRLKGGKSSGAYSFEV